jgi:hypothetical protein
VDETPRLIQFASASNKGKQCVRGELRRETNKEEGSPLLCACMLLLEGWYARSIYLLSPALPVCLPSSLLYTPSPPLTTLSAGLLLVVELAVAMVHGEESSWRMERAALPLNQALAYGVQAHAAAAAPAPPSCFLYCLSLPSTYYFAVSL